MQSRSRIVPLVFAILATFLGCQFQENTIVPDELIGVWKTAETRYADRFFELKKNQVIFGIGGHNSTVHAVLNIETEEVQEEAKTLYILDYLSSEGQEYQFSFYYHPAQDVIQFRNQQQFEWTK
ncbi:hypothetical protein MYX84_04615 [Acidobacteria bacterium AH-259-O06]|nr:hypothetical protein [Acidobacteria bacterium AH-259-O06]